VSNSWKTGHGSAWAKVRKFVLERDGYVCQLCHKPMPRSAPRDDPMAPQVHHTGSRRLTGDDPAHMVAAHRHCNLEIGDPTQHDPSPSPGGWW
jgi:5-methylcytosine-specific restriction endonuclease McrA